jgi:TolB protein
MKRTYLAILIVTSLTAAAQTQIQDVIDPKFAAQIVRIAIPSPDTALPYDFYGPRFFSPLTRDIAGSGIFAIAPIPPNLAPGADIAKSSNAQFVLKIRLFQEGQDYVAQALVVDSTGAEQMQPTQYRGTEPALSRMAHKIATDVVRAFTGKPGIFQSQIAFASDRTGAFEIWLMDWDGSNQRRITAHNGLSILPSWAPDNERLAYTSFARGTSDMYVINRRGGGRIRVPTALGLNTSATFSPVGNDIAFVGSVNGNPDIYVVKDDGSNLRRLTSESSIESTPEWSPNGRQLSFTSGRSGTPQIYVMDAEGSNVRRLSFDEGGWNDDATWSPDGERVAYTSRVGGRFQIRVANVITRESQVLAGQGSNEQPTWSPDGKWIAFQSNRTGKWQIYRMRSDGTDIIQLTFDGENKDPDWSKKAE